MIFFASLAIMSLYGFWYASSAHLRATVERLAVDFDGPSRRCGR